jgi:cytochrome o ubiquinol oxidase subunit IV
MSLSEAKNHLHPTDTAPGDQRVERPDIVEELKSYLLGLGLSILLTATAFFLSGTTLVWGPSIPVALIVLAIAQMGVHLVFFLHITTAPDSANNILALAFGVLIVLLILAGTVLIMATMNRNMAVSDGTMRMHLENGLGTRGVTARGVVTPAALAAIVPRVSGAVQSLDCDVKTKVKAGQTCAKIDAHRYETVVDEKTTQMKSARARLEKREADLSEAKTELERREASPDRRLSAGRGTDRARAAFERARNVVEAEKAKVGELELALQNAEINLGAANIVSPIDGIVVARNVRLGQTVAPGADTPLFVVAANSDVVQLQVSLGASDVGQVRIGDKAAITVATYPGRKFSGEVSQIQPVQPAGGTDLAASVIISAPNPDGLLEPGMQAMVRIVTK